MQFQTEKNILFAGRYQTADALLVKQWANFAENYNARIHLCFQTEDEGFPESFEATYSKLFENGSPDYSLEMSFFSSKNILNELINYVHNKDISLIVFEDVNDGELAKGLFGNNSLKIFTKKPGVPIISLNALPQKQFMESAYN